MAFPVFTIGLCPYQDFFFVARQRKIELSGNVGSGCNDKDASPILGDTVVSRFQ